MCSGQPPNAHEHHPPLEWLPGPAIEVIGTHVEAPTADMQLPQLPTVEAHNAAAVLRAAPTGTWTFFSNQEDVKKKLTDMQLLDELKKRGLQVGADDERWNGDKLGSAKSKLAKKLVDHDKQACWGRFIGYDQRCGEPGTYEGPAGAARTAKHYCSTCLEALHVPVDRVQIVERTQTQKGRAYANSAAPVWTTPTALPQSVGKFHSFNTNQDCKCSDVSFVVWESAAAKNAVDSAAAALPAEWLEEHGEDDAQTCVVLKFVGGIADFGPKQVADEPKRPAPASARTVTKKPRTKRVRADEAEEAEDEDVSSEEMELGDGQPAAAPPAAAVDAAEHKGREFLQALREVGGASGQSARLTSSCNIMITLVEAGLAEIRRSQMEAAEADEQDEAAAGTSEAHEASSSAPVPPAAFRSLSADDDDEDEPPASNPTPAFRALSVDDDAEDMAAVGPLARSLGAEEEEETVERVPPCTSPVDEGGAAVRRDTSFACSAEEEELAQSLPPPLQRLHEEYRALSRALFAA